MVNDIIKTALQQRTRHYHLEHAFGYVSIGVPLFGLMIVVLMLMAEDWI
jgi:hypothetical protein